MTPSTLLDALRAAGATGDLHQAATRLAADGLGADDVARLAEIARQRGKAPVGLLLAWISRGEARGVLAAAAAPVAPSSLPPTAGSCDANVSQANPYGWVNARAHVAADHDRPGEWNAHRQAYNRTETERIAADAPDHRVRTCTRGGNARQCDTPA